MEKEKDIDVQTQIKELEEAIKHMDQETEKLKELTKTIDEDGVIGTIDSADVDRRSVYVGNVDYGATPEEIQEHFKACGAINRITILVDKFSGSPKGYAYVEFAGEQGVSNAVLLNDSLFRGRQLKVLSKRTNIPGMSYKGKGKGKNLIKGKGKGKAATKGYAPYLTWTYAPTITWGKKGAKGKLKGSWY